MARGAPEPQEDEAAALLHNGARQRGWGREQLYERCRRVRGLREPRLLADPERGVQGRGDAVLDDRPAYCAEVVAGAVMERGLVRLHFLAAGADDGVFMALAARGVVEKGAQPRSGREFGLEHAATPLEQGALTERQERQRIA